MYAFTAEVVNKMKVLGEIPAITAYVDKLLGFRTFAYVCQFSLLRKRRGKKKNVEKRRFACRTTIH